MSAARGASSFVPGDPSKWRRGTQDMTLDCLVADNVSADLPVAVGQDATQCRVRLFLPTGSRNVLGRIVKVSVALGQGSIGVQTTYVSPWVSVSYLQPGPSDPAAVYKDMILPITCPPLAAGEFLQFWAEMDAGQKVLALVVDF